MQAFILRRLLEAVIVIIMVTAMVFILMRSLPGDPALMYLAQSEYGSATPEQIAEIRQEFGLDRPMPVQYFDWVRGALVGDLGNSVLRRTKVVEEIASTLPVSIYLGTMGLVVSIVVGIPLGVIAAVRRGKWADTVVTIIANAGITAPTFWLGILLMLFFSLYLKWLPVYGMTSPFTDLGMSLKQSIMPVFCIALFPMGAFARQTRSSMLEVLRQDYIRTAWSKGLTERAVITRHALKNGLIPVVTLIGLGVSTTFMPSMRSSHER